MLSQQYIPAPQSVLLNRQAIRWHEKANEIDLEIRAAIGARRCYYKDRIVAKSPAVRKDLLKMVVSISRELRTLGASWKHAKDTAAKYDRAAAAAEASGK